MRQAGMWGFSLLEDGCESAVISDSLRQSCCLHCLSRDGEWALMPPSGSSCPVENITRLYSYWLCPAVGKKEWPPPCQTVRKVLWVYLLPMLTGTQTSLLGILSISRQLQFELASGERRFDCLFT